MARTSPEPMPSLLIIDDDADQLALCRMAAERTGMYWRVETADDAKKAYEVILRGAEQVPRFVPQIVVTDVRMRKLSGIEFVKTLRSDPRVPPMSFVAMSNSDFREDVERALEAGCCAFVQKPGDFSALTEFFRELPGICHSPRTFPRTATHSVADARNRPV